ncbi:MAG: AAA family ATPase [Candidatus Dormibacteraeota bacterium]|nr:AAA family ATPase [Candidatus Dormibacteraeota bacterium]
MKIAVIGKGGSGKTTISATLSRLLARRGLAVVAIDGDPNPNLAIALGVSAQQADRLRPLPNDLLRHVSDDEGAISLTLTRTKNELETECGAEAPDGVTLLLGGQVEMAGRGCLCSKHATVRGLMGELVLEKRDVIVLDMEASIEHLSRGTIAHAERLLIVVEPYYRALETAGRIARLAPQLGIPDVMAIGNKVRGGEDEAAIRTYCAQHNLQIGAMVPYDDRVGEADRRGMALLDYAPDSRAVEAILGLSSRLAGVTSN